MRQNLHRAALAALIAAAPIGIGMGHAVAADGSPKLVPGGWLQPPRIPDPPPPLPPAATPPPTAAASGASSATPRKATPHRPQSTRSQAPARPAPPPDGQVRF